MRQAIKDNLDPDCQWDLRKKLVLDEHELAQPCRHIAPMLERICEGKHDKVVALRKTLRKKRSDQANISMYGAIPRRKDFNKVRKKRRYFLCLQKICAFYAEQQ